jgi:extracellular elastinolytic metalloproteinase
MGTDLYTRALTLALHDHRHLSPHEAARVTYRPHGSPLRVGPEGWVVQLQQTFAGVPVLRAVRSVRFLPEVPPAVTGRPVRLTADGLAEVTVPAREAAYAASLRVAADADVRVSNRRPVELAAFAQPDRPTVLRKVGFEQPLTARLRVAVHRGEPVPVWQIRLALENEGRPHTVLVSATGREARVLEVTPLTAHAVRGPVHEVSPPTPDPPLRTFPPTADRFPTLVPAADPPPPGPWVSADRTAGNNVVVMDRNEQTLAAVPDAAGVLVFQPPSPTHLDQGRVTAFYLCNFLHDFFWALGFDEAAGNFQARNVTGQGRDGDALRVFVYPGAARTFAAFVNRLDGRAPQMLLRPGPGGRHAALDPDVILHEYAHGVTDRIVGRGEQEVPFREPQSRALAEALSDYWALTLQNHLRRRQGEPEVHVFGHWIAGEPTGLRASAYGPGFTATYGSLRHLDDTSPYDAGQIFCQTLLELHGALGQGDPEVGDHRGWQVVFDATCLLHGGEQGPHFLHARDAIYAALARRIGDWGVDATALTQEVRAVFAARGMADEARSPTAGFQVVEAF